MSTENIKFYLSTEQQCSYLPDKRSASIFADPEGAMSTSIYSILINHGFRRSADFVYRPHCPDCNACKPARVPVDLFQPSKSQKRVLKKNCDITAEETLPELKAEHFDLYKKYMRTRHTDGEMDHNNPERYFEFLNSSWCDTRFIEFRLNEKLIGVAATDYLSNGLSALYTFFDPELSHLSLGTYSILWQIEKAKALEKKYLFLGYWIKECRKMSYKIKFQPLEIFDDNDWQKYIP